MPETPFWRARLESLPAHLQHRYGSYFERMERWERALDATLALWARLRRAAARSPSRRTAHRPAA